jgi:hypothetical protein
MPTYADEQLFFEKPAAQRPPPFKGRQVNPASFKSFQQI